jgi:outer membrane receptor protein involved in Fe transport
MIGIGYLQDKFEKEFLIINAGLRFDWVWLGKTVDDKNWKEQWEAATGLTPDWKLFKYKFSPRFGISFPITERTVVFFSYGHFYQLPELQYFYRDPYSGGTTGNPFLDYERTILYEFGLTHQFFNDLAIDIKSYTKDISQQVGTTQLKANLGIPVELFDNKSYGRARGIELELDKRYSNFTSGQITYTLQWADAYSSSAFEDYIRSLNDFPYPIRERRADWDVRHQIIFQGSFIIPPDEKLEVFGVPLPDNLNITVLSRYQTGQPYTPFTLDPAEAQKLDNSSTGPGISSTDLKISKGFDLGFLTLTAEMDVYNIFDQNNVQIAYGFNTATGKPYQYGDLQEATNQYYDWYTMYRLRDPRQFSTGRYIKLGFRVDW